MGKGQGRGREGAGKGWGIVVAATQSMQSKLGTKSVLECVFNSFGRFKNVQKIRLATEGPEPLIC